MVASCSNHTTAFAAFTVADSSAIVHRTYYRLRSLDDAAVHLSSEFMATLAQAFRRAVLVETERHTVPEAVDAAVDQAVTVTLHDLLDLGSAALRTQVLPTFYRTVPRTSCALDGADHDQGLAQGS